MQGMNATILSKKTYNEVPEDVKAEALLNYSTKGRNGVMIFENKNEVCIIPLVRFWEVIS